MKKIGILSVCIMMLLLLGVVDICRQKELGGWEKSGQEQPVMAKAADEVGDKEQEQEQEQGQEQNIRVLICSDDYAQEYHEEVVITSGQGFTLSYGDDEKIYEAGETAVITAEAEEFAKAEVLYLTANDGKFIFPKLQREVMAPVYEGKLEIRKTQQGLLVINELPLETYLCYVVPSEMPSEYPQEALKAQAVCARTYARKQMLEGRAKEFFADVDDSVSYQVYNNQGRTTATDSAVKETAGIVMRRDGEILDARYYSTSCGMSLNMDLSEETVFAAFLAVDNRTAYEAAEPWYRWHTEISLADFPGAAEIAVTQRTSGGRAEELEVQYASAGETETIKGEYAIREFLDGGDPVIYLQDGEEITGMRLLPSAFFVLISRYDDEGLLSGYELKGGGYGHGEGMSQNGAKAMAEEGLGYMEILENYYGDFDSSIE